MSDISTDRIRVSENFFLDEFLPPEFYQRLKKWVLIVQFIRVTSGKLTAINRWYKGLFGKNRGFRMPDCTEGAKSSMHRYMDAVDLNIGDWSPQRMYAFVVEHAQELYDLGVRRIEDIKITTGWLHLDGKEHGEACIQIINLTEVIGRIPVKKKLNYA